MFPQERGFHSETKFRLPYKNIVGTSNSPLKDYLPKNSWGNGEEIYRLFESISNGKVPVPLHYQDSGEEHTKRSLIDALLDIHVKDELSLSAVRMFYLLKIVLMVQLMLFYMIQN